MATPFFCSANSKLGRGWRSEMKGLSVVAEKAEDPGSRKGLGFGIPRVVTGKLRVGSSG